MQEGTRISWTLLLLAVVDFCVTALRNIVPLLFMEASYQGTDKLLKAFMKNNVDLLMTPRAI